MAANIPDIPRPRSNDPEVQRFYDAVRQAFSAVQRTDSQGLVTYEELGRRLLPLYDDYNRLSGKVGGGTNKCEGASVPAIVANINTSGAFGVITITWDAAIYRGHGYTEVWASKRLPYDGTDGIHEAEIRPADMELVGESDTTYFALPVPAIEFTQENEYEVTRYIWLRHVSECEKGEGPWSDMIVGSTPASPSLIGELMATHANDMLNALGLDQDLTSILAEARVSAAEMSATVDASIMDMSSSFDSLRAGLLEGAGALEEASDLLSSVEAGVYETSSTAFDAGGMYASQLEVVKAEAGDAIAGMVTMVDAVATEQSSSVDYSQVIGAEFGDNIAGVVTTIEANATESSASVDYSQVIGATVDDAFAGVNTTITATVTDQLAQVDYEQIVGAIVADDFAGVRTAVEATVSEIGSFVSYEQVIGAEFGDNLAGVVTTIEATANEAGAEVDYSQIIGAVFENDFAGVRTDIEATVNEVGAEVDYSQFIGAEFGDNLAGVTDTIEASATDVSSFVSSVQTTQAVFEDNLATIETTTKAYADESSAYASMNTALSAAVGENASAIDIVAKVDTISAKYAIQTDVNGYVQGFGLLNTGSPTTSGMAFNVANFYVTNTVNGVKYNPFMIEGGKVYADNLFVRQANIEKLNVMDIATSGIVKSANYSTNAGWMIDNLGNAVFNSVTIRGISSASGQDYYTTGRNYYQLTNVDNTNYYWGSKGAQASFTLPTPLKNQRMLVLITGRTGVKAVDAPNYSRAVQLRNSAGVIVKDAGLSSATSDFFNLSTVVDVAAGVSNSFFIVSTVGKGLSPSIAGGDVETVTDTLAEFGLSFTVNVLGVLA